MRSLSHLERIAMETVRQQGCVLSSSLPTRSQNGMRELPSDIPGIRVYKNLVKDGFLKREEGVDSFGFVLTGNK